MEKVKVTSDRLYQFLTEHGVTVSRLAEIAGIPTPTINFCFPNRKNGEAAQRQFTEQNIRKINEALPQMAEGIRKCLLTFGSGKKLEPNQRGKVYDPALVERIKGGVSRYFNLNIFCERVLKWNRTKKHNILETVKGKAYGCISKEDADRINAELLAVAGVLSSYEVVADGANGNSEPKAADSKKDNKGTSTRMEQSFESKAQP